MPLAGVFFPVGIALLARGAGIRRVIVPAAVASRFARHLWPTMAPAVILVASAVCLGVLAAKRHLPARRRQGLEIVDFALASGGAGKRMATSFSSI